MNQKNILDAESLQASCKDIKKINHLASILLSGALLLAAGILLFFSSNLQDHSSSLYMAVLTISILLILLSVYRLVCHRTQLVYTPTGSSLLNGSTYLDVLELNAVKEALKNQKMDQLKQITFKQSGNARIDYYLSADHQFVAIQLFQYIPYKFEPASDIQLFDAEDAKEMSEFLTKLS